MFVKNVQMSKLLFSFFILLLSVQSYGQKVQYILGEDDKSKISMMTSQELGMYIDCITVIGKDKEIINWASKDICELIKKDPKHFKCQIVSIDSKEKKLKVRPQLGQTTLGSEKLVLILKRDKTKSTINLLVLY